MSSPRTRFAVVAAAALALVTPLALKSAGAATANTAPTAATSATASPSFTAAQVLAGVKKNSTTANKVNSKPHINTMTRAMNVNVYQVVPGVYAYSSLTRSQNPGRPGGTRPPLRLRVQGTRRWVAHPPNGSCT